MQKTMFNLEGDGLQQEKTTLLSANNKKLRLEFTQAHQTGESQDWKNISRSDESISADIQKVGSTT